MADALNGEYLILAQRSAPPLLTIRIGSVKIKRTTHIRFTDSAVRVSVVLQFDDGITYDFRVFIISSFKRYCFIFCYRELLSDCPAPPYRILLWGSTLHEHQQYSLCMPPPPRKFRNLGNSAMLCQRLEYTLPGDARDPVRGEWLFFHSSHPSLPPP